MLKLDEEGVCVDLAVEGAIARLTIWIPEPNLPALAPSVAG
ncbi:MAG: hypothetical protein JWN22_1385, partial [Nocardioides sp.]|nr:hypothetical protein [Nocardioides sp.]